jgi:hypothetical protein
VRAPVAVIFLTLLVAGSAAAQPNPGTNGEIAFERAGTIQAFDPRAGTTRQVAQGAQPAWSPQGGIAYVRDGTIYLAGADGSNERALTSGQWPAWSPDGSRLALVRGQQLIALDVPAGTETVLAAGDVVAPAWSPDGARIAYGAGGSLFTVGLDGAAPVSVATGVAANGGPAWSPDGTQLAFVGVNGQLYVAAPDGSGTKQLTFTLMGTTGVPQRPAWSPDGTLVAWAQGPDLCVADPAGKVARLTRTQDTPKAVVVAAAPDWQSTALPAYKPVAAAAGPHDAASCDRRAGARIDILSANVSPQIASLAAPSELVFVNHLASQVTVFLPGARGTIAPGGTYGFETAPGEFQYTVTGYPDGVPRRGRYVATAAGRTSIEQHAAIRYGTSTVLSGVAAGVAGTPVVVTAKAYGSSRVVRVATLQPSSGRWQLTVAPRVTTLYTATYAGVAAERRLRVMPTLRVSRAGATVRAALAPAAVRGKPVYLFRLAAGGWDQIASVRIGRDGSATFAAVPPGRYYVGFAGNAAYWSAASEPFTIRR